MQVPGPFPWTMERYTKPLYRDRDETWPEIPDDCRLAGYCRDDRTGREWQQLTAGYMFRPVQEGIVFVGAHEVFHFPRHSRQIAGRNGENEADQFALEQLDDFRRAAELVENEHPEARDRADRWDSQSLPKLLTNPKVNGSGRPTYSCWAVKANGG